MSATIKDVAAKCGQPIYLVGRVLEDYRAVDEDTRKAILASALELGYPLEGSTKQYHTHNLGVLFVDESYSGITHPFFASMLNAFKAEAESRGYDITFINHGMSDQSTTFLDHCRFRNVDGVCLACVDFYSQEVKDLLDSEIPCVTVDHPTDRHPCILSDNNDGVKQLVDFALENGHERIAFISGQRNSEVTETRIRQFHDTMKARGLTVPEGYFMEARYGDADAVRECVNKVLDLPERPTCILLPDDSTYFAAQEVIREHELRIPADISVAGYDGIGLTQSLRPQLTTIRQDSEAMGREAAIRLIERLEHPDTASMDHVTIPVKLIHGGTVGWCNNW